MWYNNTMREGCDFVQKEITITEFENFIDTIDDMESPIIIKRKNKEDLMIIGLEHYKEIISLKKLQESEQEYESKKIYDAETVFEELRKKYEY